MTGTSGVSQRSKAIDALASEWGMTEALMGGTCAMRKAGKVFLPMWPKEDLDGYSARLNTSTLFPAFKRTVGVMAGKPFSKPVKLSDDMPDEVKTWCDNIDMGGNSLHVFCSEMMIEALAHGVCGILVEAPKQVQTVSPKGPTKAEQEAAKVRPYWIRIYHHQLVGWRTEDVNGIKTLVMLRFEECSTEKDGQFGEKQVTRYRVLEPGKWSLWEVVDGRDVEVDYGTTTLNAISYVPLYGQKIGFMLGISPLLDLAYLNVKHWQSQSDQDNILHVARVPILFGAGFKPNEEITVGASNAIMAENTGATLTFVEHTGKAIEAGQASLDALEAQMIQSGAELLVRKPGTRTAAESNNDAEANKSDLQRITENFEDAVNQALEFTSLLGGHGEGGGGTVTLFKDFGASSLAEASSQLIKDLAVANVISKETAINELKRRGELSDEVDAQDEAEKIADQAPDLSEIPPTPDSGLPGVKPPIKKPGQPQPAA